MSLHTTHRIQSLIVSYVCHLDRSSLSAAALTSLSQQTVFATPLSRALPRIRLRTRQAPQLIDQKILVTIDSWSVNSRYPDGHFVRSLGKVESKEAEQESLLLEYEVPYRPFGKAILDCLPVEGESWVVPPKADENVIWRDREDLRDLLICSIDPPGKLPYSRNEEPADDQDVPTSMMRCTPGSCRTVTSRRESVSPALVVVIASQLSFRHRGCLALCASGQRHGLGGSIARNNSLSGRQANRHVARTLGYQLVFPQTIRRASCILGHLGTSSIPEQEDLTDDQELSPEAEIVNVRFAKSVIASKEAFTYEAAQLRKDDR